MSKYEKAGIAGEVEFLAQALADAHWGGPGAEPDAWYETAFNTLIAIQALAAYANRQFETPDALADTSQGAYGLPNTGKPKKGKAKIALVDASAADAAVEPTVNE